MDAIRQRKFDPHKHTETHGKLILYTLLRLPLIPPYVSITIWNSFLSSGERFNGEKAGSRQYKQSYGKFAKLASDLPVSQLHAMCRCRCQRTQRDAQGGAGPGRFWISFNLAETIELAFALSVKELAVAALKRHY